MAKRIMHRTEDQVRDSAKIILGLDVVEDKIQQGTGQVIHTIFLPMMKQI